MRKGQPTDGVVETLGHNFERILRWVYPGGLLLALFYLSRPNDFLRLADRLGLWSVVGGGVVLGFAVYLFQANVVNQVVSMLFLVSEDEKAWMGVRWVARMLTLRWPYLETLQRRQATITLAKWGYEGDEGGRYLDYAWATYHATSLTGWLSLSFYVFVTEDCSVLAEAALWQVLVPTLLLIVFSIWVFGHLHSVQMRRGNPLGLAIGRLE